MQKLSVLVACLMTLLATANARADIALSFSLPQAPYTLGTLVNGVDGFEFTPNNDITVTALGWYDHQGDGLLHSHPVGIYNTSTQTLVAPAATIISASSLDAATSFRFENVPAFTLTAGVSYTLSGYGEGPVFDPYVSNPAGGLTIGSEITLIAARSGITSGLQFPTAATQVGVEQLILLGPNFLYVTAVPEPGSICLSILCVAGAQLYRVRSGNRRLRAASE